MTTSPFRSDALRNKVRTPDSSLALAVVGRRYLLLLAAVADAALLLLGHRLH